MVEGGVLVNSADEGTKGRWKMRVTYLAREDVES